MNKREAIEDFLEDTPLAHLWHLGMETQILTAMDDGVPFYGEYRGNKWKGFHAPDLACTPEPNEAHDRQDGCRFWKSFRIPWNAMGEPSWQDSPMTWPLEDHALGIGATGWNWEDLCSEWFGFDFDSVANHEGYGKALSDVELQAVLQSVQNIPWVEVRKSKSGRGYHIYVTLDEPFHTENHTEHAALARAILDIMSALSAQPLGAKVDCMGGNMWLWHRDSGPGGFEEVKPASSGLPTDLIPKDWKRHVQVTSRKRARSTVASSDQVEDQVKRRRRVDLDTDHQALLAYLIGRPEVDSEWSQDDWMLRTHTQALQDAHETLGLQGIYETSSQGHDLLTGNCYAFPEPNGAWEVRRFGEGADEAPCWTRDNSGWTRILFNTPPTLDSASLAYGGTRDAEGRFHFPTLEDALKALRALGYDVPGLNNYYGRAAKLFVKKGHLVCQFTASDEASPGTGWVLSKKQWERTFKYREDAKPVELPDEIVRAVVTAGTHSGFWIYSRGDWVAHPSSNAANVLCALYGVTQQEAKTMLGAAVLNHWRNVNVPFGEEYPGDRTWNRNGAQLAISPEPGDHPTWDLLLRHVGRGLDASVSVDPWCRKYGLATGEDYLKAWIASLFQEPRARLPYLFLFGEQGTGKSLFHESLALFFKGKRGYVRADAALTSKSRFNGELSGALLCVVEETNLRRQEEAYNRIKDWTTGEEILIRALHQDARDEENYTHWVQCANFADYCPVEFGDTRIVVVHVPRFIGEEIPKVVMLDRLRAEAAGFLHWILSYEIPPTPERLRIPAITTSAKEDQERGNMNPLQQFIDESLQPHEGAMIQWNTLVSRFLAGLEPNQRKYWTAQRVARTFPPQYPRGKYGGDGMTYVGNIRWADKSKDKQLRGPVVRNTKGRLQKA